MNKSSSLVGIIVPVYNTSRFLSRCLDSITTQSYENLEIILIDDGSTDNSGAICDQYAGVDRRIHVVHQPNRGASSARNYGLKLSRGEYICFIDSDDTVAPDFVSTLLDAILTTGSDISSSRMEQVKKGAVAEKRVGEIRALSGTDATWEMLYLREPNMNTPCKMFSRHIIADLRFPDEGMGEDFYFSYLALSASDSVAIVPYCMYNYVQHSDSTVHKKFSEKRLGEYRLARQIFDSCPESLRSAAAFRLFMSCFYSVSNAPAKYLVKSRRSARAQTIRQLRSRVLGDKQAPRKFKVIAVSAYFGTVFAQLLYKTWIRIAR